MKLVDLLRPKWKHTDPKIRLVAVARLTDQNAIAEVAQSDEELPIRIMAVLKLTDQALLVEVAKAPLGDRFEKVRVTAVMKLKDQDLLVELALSDRVGAPVGIAAVEALTDQVLLGKVAKDAHFGNISEGQWRGWSTRLCSPR